MKFEFGECLWALGGDVKVTTNYIILCGAILFRRFVETTRLQFYKEKTVLEWVRYFLTMTLLLSVIAALYYDKKVLVSGQAEFHYKSCGIKPFLSLCFTFVSVAVPVSRRLLRTTVP